MSSLKSQKGFFKSNLYVFFIVSGKKNYIKVKILAKLQKEVKPLTFFLLLLLRIYFVTESLVEIKLSQSVTIESNSNVVSSGQFGYHGTISD